MERLFHPDFHLITEVLNAFLLIRSNSIESGKGSTLPAGCSLWSVGTVKDGDSHSPTFRLCNSTRVSWQGLWVGRRHMAGSSEGELGGAGWLL